MEGYLSLNCAGGGGSSMRTLSRLFPGFAWVDIVASLSDACSEVEVRASSRSELADFSLRGGSWLGEKRSDVFGVARSTCDCCDDGLATAALLDASDELEPGQLELKNS